jgi:sulfite exporter TauE/SafE
MFQTQTDRTVATYNERLCVTYRFHVGYVNKQFSYVRYDILTTVKNNVVFENVLPCGLVYSHVSYVIMCGSNC